MVAISRRQHHHKNGRRMFVMGIRDSLTLTWQDLDQSPLSLFTYCLFIAIFSSQ